MGIQERLQSASVYSRGLTTGSVVVDFGTSPERIIGQCVIMVRQTGVWCISMDEMRRIEVRRAGGRASFNA